MDLILNIGLARTGNSNIGSGTVIREVTAAFGAAAFEFRHSDTELTCVASVDALPRTMGSTLHHLALLLGQDCIAAYSPDSGAGFLVGPRAAAWGAFNPEFFLLPNGTRLQTPAAKAA
jgi:hypothetical protein